MSTAEQGGLAEWCTFIRLHINAQGQALPRQTKSNLFSIGHFSFFWVTVSAMKLEVRMFSQRWHNEIMLHDWWRPLRGILSFPHTDMFSIRVWMVLIPLFSLIPSVLPLQPSVGMPWGWRMAPSQILTSLPPVLGQTPLKPNMGGRKRVCAWSGNHSNQESVSCIHVWLQYKNGDFA